MAHDQTQPALASRVFWGGLSLLIAGLFFYAASTATGTGDAYAAGMGEMSASASASADSSY